MSCFIPGVNLLKGGKWASGVSPSFFANCLGVALCRLPRGLFLQDRHLDLQRVPTVDESSLIVWCELRITCTVSLLMLFWFPLDLATAMTMMVTNAAADGNGNGLTWECQRHEEAVFAQYFGPITVACTPECS